MPLARGRGEHPFSKRLPSRGSIMKRAPEDDVLCVWESRRRASKNESRRDVVSRFSWGVWRCMRYALYLPRCLTSFWFSRSVAVVFFKLAPFACFFQRRSIFIFLFYKTTDGHFRLHLIWFRVTYKLFFLRERIESRCLNGFSINNVSIIWKITAAPSMFSTWEFYKEHWVILEYYYREYKAFSASTEFTPNYDLHILIFLSFYCIKYTFVSTMYIWKKVKKKIY